MPNRNLAKCFGLIGLCVFLVSCASTPDKPADFTPAPDGPAGYATLYLFRPFDVIGSSRSPITYIDGLKVVDLKAGSYTVVYLKPGHYRVDTKEDSLISSAYDKIDTKIDITSMGDYYVFLDQVATYDTRFAAGHIEPANTIKSLKWTMTTNRYDKMRIRNCYYLPPDVKIISR